LLSFRHITQTLNEFFFSARKNPPGLTNTKNSPGIEVIRSFEPEFRSGIPSMSEEQTFRSENNAFCL
jgi:hypothetical protein